MANRFLNNIRINDEYTLPENDGSAGQAIVTDGSGNLSFGSAVASSADSSESIHITVKNTSGAQITKGTPVYVTGETGNSGKIEIAPADASDESKMPALGILESTLSDNAEGFCVQGGLLEGLVTDTIDGTSTTANDTVYIKPGGGLTMTKPTGSNFIQNIAKVARVHASNGSLVVSSILRTNDVPTPLYIDHANQRLGIGVESPGAKLEIQTLRESGIRLSSSDITAAADELLSGIDFYSNDSGHEGVKASIQVKYDDANAAGYMTLNAGDNSEKMRITSDGNVGIGTASPFESKLQVVGRIRAAGGTSGGYFFGSEEFDGGFYAPSDGNLAFSTNNSERIRINSNGNVGIGTTSPGRKLDISGITKTVGFQNTNNYVEGFLYANFVNGVADQNYDIQLGNISFWGYIEVEITGTYSNQNTAGKLTKIYAVGANPAVGSNAGIIYTNDTRVSDSIGTIKDNIALGDFRFDGTDDTGVFAIRVSHIVSTGNGYTIKVRAFTHGSNGDNGAAGILTNLNLSSVYTQAALTRQYVYYNSNVGIGTTDPSEKLDVSGNIAVSGTVDGVDISAFKSSYDNHNHDGRYYTETESDSRFINVTGDTMTGDLRFQDNVKILMGAGDMFQIKHAGTLSQIATYEGDLFIDNNAADKDIIFRSDDGSGGLATYLTLDGSAGNIKVYKNMNFQDNDVLQMGTSGDLNIYHDGSNSYIQDTGTGTLNLQGSTQVIIGGTNGEVGVQYVENAGVNLRHNNATKLSTESTGVNITGQITLPAVTGRAIVVGGDTTLDNADVSIYLGNSPSSYGFDIQYTGSGSGNTNSLDIISTNAGSPVTALKILQDGQSTFTSNVTAPAFLGDLNGTINTATTGVTQTAGNNSTKIATTAYADAAAAAVPIGDYLPLAGGTMTGGLTISNAEGYSTGGWGVGTGQTPVGKILNSSGVFNIRAETGRQISFGNVTNGEAVRIDSSGNVGIGTTNPDSLLHVSADVTEANTGTITIEGRPVGFLGDNIATIDFHNNGSKRADIRMERGSTANDSQLVFSTSDAGTLNDALIINEVGNVGIGTTGPLELLHLESTDPLIRFDDTNSGLHYIIGQDGDGFKFTTNNSTFGKYTFDSNVGIGTTSPGAKLHIQSGDISTSFTEVIKLSNIADVGGGPSVFFKTSGNDAAGRYGVKLGAVRSDSNNGSSVFKIQQELDNGSGTLLGLTDTFTINQYGNVGIGTTTPLRKLHVVGNFAVNAGTNEYYGVNITGGEGANPNILIGDWHNSSANIGWNSSSNYLRIDSQHGTNGAPIVFSGNDSAIEYMRITSNGELIINGTTSAYGVSQGYPLHVKGTSSQGYVSICRGTQNSGSEGLIVGTDSTNAYLLSRDNIPLILGNNNLSHVFIKPSGNVGIGDNNPTMRLKVVDSTSGLVSAFTNSSSGGSGIQITAASGTNNILQLRDYAGGEKLRVQGNGNVGVGTTGPSFKLTVAGGISAGGKVTYTKSAGSLNTTGYAVAGLTTGYNGASCMFTFTCFGHTGGYQKVVYSCYNSSGIWYAVKAIDEGTNQLDIEASANGTTITFTFKSRSGTMSYTPRVTIEASGSSINNTYA